MHEFPLSVRGGIPFELRLTGTAGTFAPALVIHDEMGTTIADGELGLVEPGLFVDVVDSGVEGGTATVWVEADADRELIVYVTGWSVIDGGFMTPLPTDVAYRYEIENDCTTELPLVTPPNFDPADVVGGYYLLPESDPRGCTSASPTTARAGPSGSST